MVKSEIRPVPECIIPFCTGVDDPVNVSDANEIMRYGVMLTPAIVIDGKVVSTGRMLSVKQIEKLIKERI